MGHSNDNIRAFLIDANQYIEDHADNAVKSVIEERNFDFLAYPPNWGFTDEEKKELAKLDNNESLKNALRKVIANSSSGVVFDLLNLLDGTSDPYNDEDNWTGLKLVDKKEDDEDDPHNGEMLHDSFLEAYWDWKERRPEKGWKLDTHEG